MHEPLIKFNPCLEALCFGDTIALFVGDRTLTLKGDDSLDFFMRVKAFFQHPRSKAELEEQLPDVYEMLSELLSSDILVEEKTSYPISFVGDGKVLASLQDAIRKHPIYARAPLLICFSETKGLTVQNKALSSLEEGQFLLTGIFRSTSVFIPPLFSKTNTGADLVDSFKRLLATEAGIGNNYLASELEKGSITSQDIKPYFDDNVAFWVSSNIHALINQGGPSTNTAYIYRGCFLTREEINLEKKGIPVGIDNSLEKNLNGLLDMFVGTGKPISHFDVLDSSINSFPFYIAHVFAARSNTQLFEEDNLDNWGTGESRESALVSGIMEALERYSVSSYNMEEYPLFSQQSLKSKFIDRNTVDGYADADFPPEDIPVDQPRRWHPITNLATGEGYFAPLELIRYPVDNELAGYCAQCLATSSGVAAYFGRDAAISHACHELVERDAFLIAWLRKAAPPLINIDTLPERIKRKVMLVKNCGFDVKILDLSTDLAPVFCVKISLDKGVFRHTLGASSKDDPEEAILKAFDEAYLQFEFGKKVGRLSENAVPADKDMGDTCSPTKHRSLFADGEFDNLLNSFFCGEEKPFSSIKIFSQDITFRIQQSGYQVFIADLDNPKIKEIAPTISIVRAIVPGLVPIHFGKKWARTGSARIMCIPEKMGWKTEIKSVNALQRFPHPFA